MRCSLCKGRSQKSRALSRPGSAWLAGVREQRWMNWVRPSASQARPRFFQALAQLSFPLSTPTSPGANLPSSAGCFVAWRVARTLILQQPGCMTSASFLFLPGPFGL